MYIRQSVLRVPEVVTVTFKFFFHNECMLKKTEIIVLCDPGAGLRVCDGDDGHVQ